MTTTTVYYASNNEKQPNCFQLVIGSCSYELPKIEIYEILNVSLQHMAIKKNHALKNKQNVLLKATVVYMFPNKR